MSSQLKKLFFILLFGCMTFYAQAQKRVVQVSGLVVSGENAVGVPGVAVYVPKTTRGTLTNEVGFFTLPTLAGDSCHVSSLGFKKQKVLVPDDGRDAITLVLYLKADTAMLPAVEILPFPTEKEFKQAFLNLNLNDPNEAILRKNFDPNLIARMSNNMGMTSSMNHRYFMSQSVNRAESRYFAPTLSLLNPFAWARFIESVKRGDLKKKSYKEED